MGRDMLDGTVSQFFHSCKNHSASLDLLLLKDSRVNVALILLPRMAFPFARFFNLGKLKRKVAKRKGQLVEPNFRPKFQFTLVNLALISVNPKQKRMEPSTQKGIYSIESMIFFFLSAMGNMKKVFDCLICAIISFL